MDKIENNPLHLDLLKILSFPDGDSDTFIKSLGVELVEKAKEDPTHSFTNFRVSQNQVFYGFVHAAHYQSFVQWLSSTPFNFQTSYSNGAIFPYHVIINRGKYKTYYKDGDFDTIIEGIKTIKNIVVRAQDYEKAAMLRDLEKTFFTLQTNNQSV